MSESVLAPLRAWHLNRLEVLTEGRRARTGAAPGIASVRHYRRTPNSFYPACSKHGAMNAVGTEIWRCLAPECNVGCKYPVPPKVVLPN